MNIGISTETGKGADQLNHTDLIWRFFGGEAI